MKNFGYKDRLKELKLPSLQYRRFRGDLIETYKIINNYYDAKTTNKLFERVTDDCKRSHNFKLKKNNFNTNQYKYFFTNRVINPWNKLPYVVVNSSSLNIFKNKIDSHFKSYMYETNFNLFYDS